MDKKITFFVFVLLVLLSAPRVLIAQDQNLAHAAQRPAAGEPAQTLSSPAIDIVPGEDGGSIRFVIDGKPVGWFDADGLHVIGDIEYGASLTDTGPEALRDTVRKMGGYDE